MTEIKVTPLGRRVVVRAGATILGESLHALALTEGNRAPVIYVPRADIPTARLDQSDRLTTCPH